MKCSKCGNELTTDAIFCNKCGKKVHVEKVYVENVELDTEYSIFKSQKSKGNKKSVFLILLSFLCIILLSVFFGKMGVNFLSSKFVEKTEEPTQPIKTNTPKISEKPKPQITTPPNQKPIIKYTGFSKSEIVHEDELFIVGKQSGVFRTKLSGVDMKKICDEKVDSLFVSDDFVYFLESGKGISSMTFEGENKKLLVEPKESQIKNFYVNEDFIFHTVKTSDMVFSLYRTNKDGSDSTLIKENIHDFIVDDYLDNIYYTTTIANSNYDSKNHFEKFASIKNEGVENGNYFTVMMCDFAGGADVKIIEIAIPVSDIPSIVFSDMGMISDQLLLKLSYEELYKNDLRKVDLKALFNLYIVDLNSLNYEIINSADDYTIYNEEVFYNTSNSTYRYNYLTSKNDKLSENLSGYKTKVLSDTIYYTMDDKVLFSTNLDGTNKKYLIDIDRVFPDKNSTFGELITADKDNIYFKNIVIKNDLSEITLVDRESGALEKPTDYTHTIFDKHYDWQDAYLKYLTNPVFKEFTAGETNNYLIKYGLCDINADGVPELIIGNSKNNLETNYSLDIEAVKILYYDSIAKEYENPSENIFSNEIRLFKDTTSNQLISSYSLNKSYFTNYITINDKKLISTPVLRRDLLEDYKYKYFHFLNNAFVEISQSEYSDILATIEKNANTIKPHSINNINIIRSIYFYKTE